MKKCATSPLQADLTRPPLRFWTSCAPRTMREELAAQHAALQLATHGDVVANERAARDRRIAEAQRAADEAKRQRRAERQAKKEKKEARQLKLQRAANKAMGLKALGTMNKAVMGEKADG